MATNASDILGDTTKTTTTTTKPTQTGTESSLSTWAGPYVTDMLGKGRALANEPYYAYTGPLTAGPSELQEKSFSGIAGLTESALPSVGTFTPTSFTDPGTAQQYMNPYIQAALQPQIDELRRQTEISRAKQAGQLSRAGAYGGSRQALADAELTRAMLANMADVTGKGYASAFQSAQQQFNQEQARQQAAQDAANVFGLSALARQAELGDVQRGIEQEGITADKLQFEEERAFPYKQVQYMQSLLQGLPIAAQAYQYQQPSFYQQLMKGAGEAGGLLDLLGDSEILGDLFGGIFGDGLPESIAPGDYDPSGAMDNLDI